MKLFLFALLVAHGIAHLVGFVVPWRLLASADMPYKTTILAGRIDVGANGIRLVGVLWLLVGAMTMGAAIAWRLDWPDPMALTAAALLLSLPLCIVEWPLTKIGLAVDVVLLVALPVIAQDAWNQQSVLAMKQLDVGGLESVGPFAPRLDDLPAPVARYFRHVLPRGVRNIASVELTQTGEMLVGNAWRPLRARQRYITNPPGFVWDARITMAPLIAVNVRDMYARGSGSMRAKALGIAPIVNQAGAAELDAGALHRYFAEAVWFPTALLPGPQLTWSPLDDRRALATLHDRHTKVTLEFRFNDADDVAEVFARDRFAEHDGRYEPRPWLVRCRNHQAFEGIRVPVDCEVEWQLERGPVAYWRGRVSSLRYTFSED